MHFDVRGDSSRCPLAIKKLRKSFGDRVAIMGDNGCGKTTLLRMITGAIQPDAGSVTLGPSVRIGYYSQEHEGLRLDRTILEEILSACTDQSDARTKIGT